ncbi:polysaccharide pyruvyl transferase family protein [Enterococcus faecium]|uniref:polysaccharide pyruvyl transferase family protein n=1 Tax=Enterococcus faecium TaxID=1352 RepID=UPI001F06B260|nr:polysaccharide pyruvyl transferase family protein [Enterococcus faecium]MCH1661444.1 polysaccharide pyruvyl transferase family protein [Enterococcus faecium]WDW18514.1 polysaccharide pyruvyl transferase family protein [Enterococcus faecium]
MKIAIQTIVDYDNYGNRLQNYALQKILEKKKHEVVTLKNDFQNPYLPVVQSGKNLNKIIHSMRDGSFFIKIRNKIKLRRKLKLINKYQKSRNDAFRRYTDKYIYESREVFNNDLTNINELETFDCFVIGSDQVWNYEFPRFSKFDFLPSVHQPKISYAASFGVNSIREDLKKFYKNNLSTIEYISVREDKGKEIINELLPEKEVKVVLDPTLMLSKQEWENLIAENKTYRQKFVLTYFLDEPTKENQKYIKKIATENNLEIKQLADVFDEELWLADPAEFVNLFSQAEMIFTDSFHACVFSIIFEKYFEIFERNTSLKSMNSRIETLMSNLHTGNRWHRGNSKTLEIPDYKTINEFLGQKREESFEFLESALIECQKKIKVEADV